MASRGITLSGTIKIYKQVKTNPNGQNYPVYSTTISSKDKSGAWKSAYITVKFRSGTDIANKSVIEIKNGFPSFNPNTPNGEKYPFYFIDDYEIIEEGEDGLRTAIETSDIDDLPFM